MGFTTSNLSLYHTFSKTPVDSNINSAAAQLGNAINKSGHTVQSNEIWTESIPFFGLAATTTAIHNKFSATAKVNDLVKDSDGKIWQRNSTAYSASAKFADLWSEKTKSITSFIKGADGKYTFTETNEALADGSYLLNSDGVPTVKYYEKRKLTILTADNNANTDSDKKASRLQIDGKWIDQFIGVTDIYVNGSAAVSYAPVLRKTKDDAPMQAGPGKGYMDYCATGLILWESSAAGTEVIDCFEYVGEKLDTTLDNLSDTIKDIVDVSLGEVVANIETTDTATNAGISIIDTNDTGSGSKTSPQIAFAEGSITDTETKLVSGKTVKKYVDEQRIWDLNDYLVKNIHLDWVQEAIRLQGHHTYGAQWDLQYVYIPNAKSLYLLAENDVWNTRDSARHKAAADAWINDVLTSNGKPKVQLVFGNKDSYATCNLIRRMFWQMDIDAGLEYGSENSYSRRYLKPGLQVKYNTILDDGTVRDPFTSNERINAEKLEDSSSNVVQGYVIYTWAGPRKGSDANYGINFGGVPTITPDETWSSHRFEDSIDYPYNWTYTVTENEIKFVQSNSYKALQQATNKLDEIGLSDASKAAGLSVLTDGEGSKTSPLIDITTASYTKSTTTGSLGTWDNQKLNNLATAQSVSDAVADAKAYADSLHTTSVTYHVTDSLPTVPTGKEEEYKGKIYLVLTGIDGVVAADGNRIEYMYVQENGVWGWEQIGTTTADLSDYAKTTDLNGAIDALNATDVGTGAVKVSQSKGIISSVTVETEALVSEDAIKTSVTNADALVKAGDALEAIRLAKPENYVASVTGYTEKGAEVTTTQGAAVKILDERGTTVTTDDLWGDTVTLKTDDTLTIAHNWVTNPTGSINIPWNTSITKVEDNKAYTGDTFYANIQTERLKDGNYMFYDSQLASFNSDLSSLVNGSHMFDEALQLTSFNGDLSSLVDGSRMFSKCPLTSFDSNLSSLVNGGTMFYNTKLSSFDSNLSSIVNGNSMFYDNNQLASFDSNLSSLVNGGSMFYNTQLASFDSDLSSLVTANNMFNNCPLTSFTGDLSSLVTANNMFNNCPLTSFTGDLSSLVDGTLMFSNCPLTSFTGDLSSLVNGSGMFSNSQLDIKSIDTICGTLPNKSDIKTWNEEDKKYENWTDTKMFFYPYTDFDSINLKKYQNYGTISSSDVCSITISLDPDVIPSDKDTIDAITNLFENTAKTKGWTIYTNEALGSMYSPTVAMADGTIQRYIYVIKREADKKTATYVDGEGKYWTVDTTEAIIGPNVKYWSIFATVEDAITEWGLTPYTKA